jgi:hypothetical protein
MSAIVLLQLLVEATRELMATRRMECRDREYLMFTQEVNDLAKKAAGWLTGAIQFLERIERNLDVPAWSDDINVRSLVGLIGVEVETGIADRGPTRTHGGLMTG